MRESKESMMSVHLFDDDDNDDDDETEHEFICHNLYCHDFLVIWKNYHFGFLYKL